jgi:hypothetical protein
MDKRSIERLSVSSASPYIAFHLVKQKYAGALRGRKTPAEGVAEKP